MGNLTPKKGRLVMCPHCRGCFRAFMADEGWYRREVAKRYGYPELACSECQKAVERARSNGTSFDEERNWECVDPRILP